MVERDLFADAREAREVEAMPLPARMRPRSLDEVVGQPHLLAPGAAFRTMVEQGRPVSMILWGPPGTGKTTLARLVASESDAAFEQLSAVNAGVKDVREVLARARRRLGEEGKRTVLFLDEIHRFSRSQQDALLPGVESGTVILVGATTENPFFEVNSPLISRSTLFRLEPLTPDDIRDLLDRAMSDPRGLGGRDLELSPDARDALADRVGGDARLALGALEVAALIAEGRGRTRIGVEEIGEALQRRVVRYDKSGDQHYDVISAFIKSLRGSDPDAALYWLHTMLEAGEDPEFIARRMIVFASEDVGLADPDALSIAVDAFSGLQVVGLPEAAYTLSHAALYLALAPKSDTVKRAMGAARRLVEETPGAAVPPHLRSTGYRGATDLGHGVGYRDPHAGPGHVVRQRYLPEGVEDAAYVSLGTEGVEPELAARLRAVDEVLGKRRPARDEGPSEGGGQDRP